MLEPSRFPMQGCHAWTHLVLSSILCDGMAKPEEMDPPTQRDPAHQWSPAIDRRADGLDPS